MAYWLASANGRNERPYCRRDNPIYLTALRIAERVMTPGLIDRTLGIYYAQGDETGGFIEEENAVRTALTKGGSE